MELSNYCKFRDGTVYLLVALARPKENPELDDSDVFRRIVTHDGKIEQKRNELKALTNTQPYRYRLYVTANPRSVEDGLYLLDRKLSKIAHDRDDTNPKRMDKEWFTQLQQSGSKADNRFVIDVDAPELAEDVREELRERTTIHTSQETPNGVHFITEPFDYTLLQFDEDDVEVRTDGLLFVSFLE